eukprot:COSAG06_NODE_894_length_11709_cov_6.062010_2_plen_123_part_00
MGDELTEDDQRDMEGLGADDPARDPALLQFQLRVARAPDQVRFHAKTRSGGRTRAHAQSHVCARCHVCVCLRCSMVLLSRSCGTGLEGLQCGRGVSTRSTDPSSSSSSSREQQQQEEAVEQA